MKVFELFGRLLMDWQRQLGEFLLFCREAFVWTLYRPFRTGLVFRQMEFIGVRSLPIIALTATFTGMVFALQTGYAFRLFNAEPMVGSTVGLAVTREIGPVFTALMVVARAGSAMAAEIGTMRVTEQVDALEAMAVYPVQYLVVPRLLASAIMVPILSGIFSFIAVLGAYLVSIRLLDISELVFTQKLVYFVDADDVIGGILKSFFFGIILALICCHRGYRTRHGAEGVGRATTQAVVIASVAILVLDYFLTAWILEYFPEF